MKQSNSKANDKIELIIVFHNEVRLSSDNFVLVSKYEPYGLRKPGKMPRLHGPQTIQRKCPQECCEQEKAQLILRKLVLAFAKFFGLKYRLYSTELFLEKT